MFVLLFAVAGQAPAAAATLPVDWSPTKNVGWKQPVPGIGWSAPVVSRGQVIVTSGIPGPAGNLAMHVLCFDAASGRLAWNTEVHAPADAPFRPGHEKSLPSHATPVVEDERIYVYFGHHGAACLDRAGRIVWRNPRVRFDPGPANAGSPALVGDRLVYLADGATAPAIVALNKHTGQTLWRVPRTLPAKMRLSFSTPLAIVVGGRAQVIVPGDGAVVALDPADGRELWRVRHSENYAAMARPVFAHGLLYVSAGYNRGELRAIRPDGTGDVTDTHIVWRTVKGAPITPALVALEDALYAVNDAGVATCWDAATGAVRWQERLPGNYSATPAAAEGRLYFQNETGIGTVMRAGAEFVRLATNDLGEPTFAAPAVGEGALFVRTATQLYRLQAKL